MISSSCTTVLINSVTTTEHTESSKHQDGDLFDFKNSLLLSFNLLT